MFAQEAIDDDFQMELAHASDDGLTSFGVRIDAKRRIFIAELGQRDAHLVLILLRLGFDGYANHRLGERDGLEHDWLRLVAQRVAGNGAFRPDDRGDLARSGFGDVLTLVGMQLHQPTHALALIAARVVGV